MPRRDRAKGFPLLEERRRRQNAYAAKTIIETARKRGKSLVSGLMDLFRSDNQASDPIPSDRLYHWDGQDMVPGKDRPKYEIGTVRLLGEIQSPEGGKAEGVTVLREGNEDYDLLIVYDGVKGQQRIMQ